MQNLITSFVQKLTPEDVKKFALKNKINLSPSELEFTYSFIKNNYSEILKDPDHFDFNQYQKHYTRENFAKIEALIKVYINYL